MARKENAINAKINDVSTDLATFKSETNTTISQNQSAFNAFKEETNTKFTTTKEELTELINTTLDSIYPVGSVYISLNSTNPGTYLKGTWEQFAQGRTLIGVGSGSDGSNTQSFAVNDTGGEYKHLISKKNYHLLIMALYYSKMVVPLVYMVMVLVKVDPKNVINATILYGVFWKRTK